MHAHTHTHSLQHYFPGTCMLGPKLRCNMLLTRVLALHHPPLWEPNLVVPHDGVVPHCTGSLPILVLRYLSCINTVYRRAGRGVSAYGLYTHHLTATGTKM